MPVNETLDSSIQKRIDNILTRALGDNRNVLFENEVYEILEEIEIETPRYVMIRDVKDITKNMLSIFGTEKVVLKIVSKDISHKQKSGGVKVVYKDLEFVQYSFRKMMSLFENEGYTLHGILIVEYVEYSKDLGNEILLGFRDSEAFGPVISFSKGGTDAEHFAKNFSPPNLILAPIDRKWVQALLESTKIQEKYIAEGNTDYITKIVMAGVKFSALAANFSNLLETESQFIFKEFEVNPFVFNPEGHFIAIDGFACFEEKDQAHLTADVKPKETLSFFFEPNGIAIVGISAHDKTKAGNVIAQNLLKMERNDIYCININGGTVSISGKTFDLHKSVCGIDNRIDLAIITVPAEGTIPVVEDCAKKGVKAIILIPGGFSEISKNREVEEKIKRICEEHDIRVMGPNCLGIVYADEKRGNGINTFFIPEEKFKINLEKDKNVAIISQSGGLGITEIHNLRNAISPKVIVSYGNQLDVDACDLAHYFEDDPAVDVIGFYIEGFKKGAGRKFFNITSQCKKPIIVYKA